MSDTNGADPVHAEAMAATAASLGEHGFADVTMRDVAARMDASKSTLHYRYDSKEGLITAFLEHLTEDMEALFAEYEDEPPLDRLVGILDANLERLDDPEQQSLNAAYVEIHARASRSAAFREVLAESDQRYREELAEVVAEGIEADTFRGVDPWATATLLLAVPDSAGLHRATLGNETAVDDLRTAVNDLVFESLLTEAAKGEIDREDLL